MANVVTEKLRTARKLHFCCECGLPIRVGVMYVYASGIWDGNPDSYRQHVECRELLTKIGWVVARITGAFVYGTPVECVGSPVLGEYRPVARAAYVAIVAKYGKRADAVAVALGGAL